MECGGGGNGQVCGDCGWNGVVVVTAAAVYRSLVVA